jgi:HPt (histidine-containing phosphotransfer) domain-containing protein
MAPERIRLSIETPQDPAASPADRPSADYPTLSVLDCAEALDRFGGDRSMLEAVLGIFLEAVPEVRARLARALETSQPPAIRREAHAVRGAAGHVGGLALQAAAFALETAAAENRSAELSALGQEVLRQLALLESRVRDYLAAPGR